MVIARIAPARSEGRPALHHVARAILVAVVAVIAGAVGLTAWGGVSRDVGPLRMRLTLAPALSGDLRVQVPPLGQLHLSTHDGPLRLNATVTGVDVERANALLDARRPGRTVTSQIAADVRGGLLAVITRALVVVVVSSALTCLIVFRRAGAAVGGTAAAAMVLGSALAVGAATLRTQALTEPKFDGLLAHAPVLAGRVQDFDAYSQRVAELTSNVARVYGGLAELPATPPGDDTQVLWVSDIHNNPQAFAVMSQLIEQFDVAAIVDTGDIVDLGTAVENRQLSRIGTLGVPYLYVRGNHDRRDSTQTFIAQQSNAHVLDQGGIVTVAGIRFTGIGHPLFRPNKAAEGSRAGNDALLRSAGEQLAATLDAADDPVDVVLAHESAMTAPVLGKTPLVLTGHAHERSHQVDDGTLRLTQGSSGGAGLRTWDGEDPLPLQMSVLHFDAGGALLAVDDIDVGGLGKRYVTLERRSPDAYGMVDEAQMSPSPTPVASFGRD